MNKENKIISFEKRKKDNISRLKAEISIYIKRQGESFIIDWHSADKNISQEEIYNIQKKALASLVDEVPQIEVKKIDNFEITFTLLYYEKGKRNFKFIMLPQYLKKEKLAEYLFISTSVYEYNKSSTQ